MKTEQHTGLRSGMGVGGDSDSISRKANAATIQPPPPPLDYEPKMKPQAVKNDSKDVWHGWPKNVSGGK